MQWILSKIKLKATNTKIDVKVGNTLVNELQVSASFTDNGNSVIVTNLPIQFSFIKGDGTFVDGHFRTEANETIADNLGTDVDEDGIAGFFDADMDGDGIAESIDLDGDGITDAFEGLADFLG